MNNGERKGPKLFAPDGRVATTATMTEYDIGGTKLGFQESVAELEGLIAKAHQTGYRNPIMVQASPIGDPQPLVIPLPNGSRMSPFAIVQVTMPHFALLWIRCCEMAARLEAAEKRIAELEEHEHEYGMRESPMHAPPRTGGPVEP